MNTTAKNSSLKNKLINLVSVDRRDSSIFTPFNSTHFSMVQFASKEELIAFFETDKSEVKITSLPNTTKLESELKAARDFQSFLSVLDKYQIDVAKYRLKKLERKFSAIDKAEVINSIKKTSQDLEKKFKSLNKKAQEIEKDRGTWNLYLARYFLKGITPYKKEAINAPLILYQVEIVFVGRTIVIKKINENNDLNEKLIVFLQKDSEIQNKSISDFKVYNTINDIKKQIEEVTLKESLEIDPNSDLAFIRESTTDIERKYQKLVIEDRFCLGIFDPSGGKLKSDLQQILDNNESGEIFNQPLITTKDQVKLNDLKQNPLFQIDRLDLYQKYAVRSSISNNTIIHGPPGTGKSEVIANIIINLLMNDKTVLMVSEKVAALEVLSKRLKKLSIFMLSVYDTKNKSKFYDSIVNLAEFIGDSWKVDSANAYIENSKKKQITLFYQQNFEKIRNFKNLLNKLNEFKNFSVEKTSFLKYWKIFSNFGGFSALEKIKKSNLLTKFKEGISFFNNDEIQFFKLLERFIHSCKINNIDSEIKLQNFLARIFNIRKIFDQKLLEANHNNLSKIKANAYFLKNYLGSKKQYQEILRNDPFLFYNDVKNFKQIKKEIINLINEQFFNQFSNHLPLVNQFVLAFKKANDRDKKFILDKFKQELVVINKKPLSKMFYTHKLSNEDQILIKNLEKLNDLNLTKYQDFNYIVENHELFHPISIINFFDDNIVNDQNLSFVNQKLTFFDFSFFQLYHEHQMNIHRWRNLKKILHLKPIFESQYPNFVGNILFQEYINDFNKLDWSKFAEPLMISIREVILKKLTNLNPEDKKLLIKAINVAKLKRRPAIYAYLSKYASTIKNLIPIWVSRPEAAAICVPLIKNYFDYGIYDEASQMFLERAYPILYRSKINIVAGDDKQLLPSNFFSSSNFDSEDEYDVDDLDVEESLLDRAISSSWNVFMLQNHYRSETKELIEFPSQYIYDKKLNYASKNGTYGTRSLEIIEVNGHFEDGLNIKEATCVIKLLTKLNLDQYPSVLVITFNRVQANYISEILIDAKQVGEEITKKYLDGHIGVINLENVQGTEADLVILSISYGKYGLSGKPIRSNFGPLTQRGGKNRLNVAITRAKKKMIVLKSLSSANIKDSYNENLNVFRNFLAFLERYEHRVGIKSDKWIEDGINDLFKEVFEEIHKIAQSLNLEVEANYEVGNKNIDIVVIDPQTKIVVLGIKIEDWNTKFDMIERQHDLDDQEFFEARDYRIFKILEHEWKTKKNLVLREINQKLSFMK
ncbi:DNA2/NAM7-like helicase [[Mycoplasma] cavipharyngis]|uniref:AAA domain-containing protein n=1 Tax=[Mycoplasma] cavipharyngis TaxID=92757 RepID=UPI0037042B22